MPVRRRTRGARGPRVRRLPAALALLLLSAAVAVGVTRSAVPGPRETRLNAVVADAPPIAEGSPVWIAGVAVGRVTRVDARGAGTTSTLRMALDDGTPTVRGDATLRIRPRVALGDELVVDLVPGTPTSPPLGDDATLPLTRTSSAVPGDGLAAAVPDAARGDLRRTIAGLGEALSDEPSAADALNGALLDAPLALRTGSDALRGVRADDVSGLIASAGAVASGLEPGAARLRGAVRAIDGTLAVLRANRGALRAALRELPATLERADATLPRLDAAFPAVQRLLRELLPGIRATGPAVDAAGPWVRAARGATVGDGLRRLAAGLRPTVPALARLTAEGRSLLPRLDDAAQCLNRVVIPAANQRIEDGRFTTGREAYKSVAYGLVGLAGEVQNSDEDGSYGRVQTGLGPRLLDLGPLGDEGNLLAAAPDAPIGVRPVRPGRRPPYRDDRPCRDQPVPDANAARSAPGDAAAVVGRASGTAPRGRAAVGASSAADDERLARALDDALGALDATGEGER